MLQSTLSSRGCSFLHECVGSSPENVAAPALAFVADGAVGAFTPLLLLWLGVELWARIEHWHYYLFVTTPSHCRARLYRVRRRRGAVAGLLCVRTPWVAWLEVYVPTAILAALLTQVVITIGQHFWMLAMHWAAGLAPWAPASNCSRGRLPSDPCRGTLLDRDGISVSDPSGRTEVRRFS